MNPARRATAMAAPAVVLAIAAGLLSAATAPTSAAPHCTSPVFKRQFYANTTFSGTPKKTDCDSTINENWGAGAPSSALPRDKFGVRWSLTRDFGSGGTFTFTASAQDGVRVHLDGKLKIDLWKNVTRTVRKSVDLTIAAGSHSLRVDYVNWTGSANVRFGYAPRTTSTVDKVKPLTPTGPSVSYDTSTGKARFTWTKNKEMDLAGEHGDETVVLEWEPVNGATAYHVHRWNPATGAYERLAAVSGTTYTDLGAARGTTHFYWLTAVYADGTESAPGADWAATTPAT